MHATDQQSDATTAPGTDASVDDLSPSAKLVYKVLEYEGPMTQEEIATESRLCPRTVRYALGKLEHHGTVTSRVNLEDARQSIYKRSRRMPRGLTPGLNPIGRDTNH